MQILRTIWLVTLLFSLTGFASSVEGLNAGAFAQDISPTTFPVRLNGGMKGGFADSIHDPMHARCLAISN